MTFTALPSNVFNVLNPYNTGQIRFLLEIKNSRYLKVGVCALARPQHKSAIIAIIPTIKSVQIKRFVYGVLPVE